METLRSGDHRLRRVARIGVQLMMAGIIPLPASTGYATPSTISHNKPASITAPSGSSKAIGKRRASGMAEDKFDKLGPLLNAIGGEAAVIVGGDPDGLYIYAEPADGTVYAAVFKDEGVVRYFDPTDELAELIGHAWEMEGAKAKRWVVMEYSVTGRKFDVELTYPEDINPDDHASDRRRAALKRHYGDRRVVYPPMPDHMRK
jgi:hypothetical protein